MDGFKAEKHALLGQGAGEGTFIRLDQESQPGVHQHCGKEHEVARSEHLTYICTPSKDGGGPTNNWMDPATAYAKLRNLFCGSMKGRTMYVVPFIMGPTGSALAKLGVEITDSLYAVVNMGIMTRVGDVAWKQLGFCQEWTRCLHSSGGVNSDQRYICHFPQDNTIWSFGSGYGGNALLGKKCLAPHRASYLGNQQNWILPYADAGEAGSIDVQAFAAIQRIPTLLEQLLAVMSKPAAAPPRVKVRGDCGGDDEDDLRQLWRQLTPEQRSILRFIWKEGDNVLNYALIAANMTVPRLPGDDKSEFISDRTISKYSDLLRKPPLELIQRSGKHSGIQLTARGVRLMRLVAKDHS
jgi:hypothetical protein